MSYSHPQHGRTVETGHLRKEAGRVLKEKREAAGLTQRRLAEEVGFEYYTFIAQIEAGRGRIPPDRYDAYAKALGIPSKEFVKTMLRFYDPVTYQILFGISGDESDDG